MKIVVTLVLANLLSFASCQKTTGSRVEWTAITGSTGSEKINELADTQGRKAANVELPGVAELPKVPSNVDMPNIIPVSESTVAELKTTKAGKLSTEPAQSTTDTQPIPTTPKTTTTTKVTTTTSRPTTQPTTKTTTKTTTTKATPVIMVQHSLSGISGPSNVISEATEWIATDKQRDRSSNGGRFSRQFSGVDVARQSDNIRVPKQQSTNSQQGNDMQSFVGMLTPQQKQALMSMLGGGQGPPPTTTQKPTTPAPKPASDMQALKMKLMQSVISAMAQGGGGMGGMAGMGGMGGMPGMAGLAGMEQNMLMEALGGGTTDPAEQMSSQRFNRRAMGLPGMGSAGLGGRGRGFGRGGAGGDFSKRDPMMQRMLLDRQMRSRRPGFDPTEANEKGLGGEGMSPLLMAAMMGGGSGDIFGIGSGSGGGGNDMAGLLGAMGGMGGMGGMAGLGGMAGMAGLGGGGTDMASMLAAMNGGSSTGGAGSSPADLMALIAAMGGSSSSSGSGSSQNETKGSSAAESSGFDMTSFLASGAGMGSGMGSGMSGGMGGGMGNMAELQMLSTLMGGGADPPAAQSGMDKFRSSTGQNSPMKPSSNSVGTSSGQNIPDWLMQKLISTNNANPQQLPRNPTAPAPIPQQNIQPTMNSHPQARSMNPHSQTGSMNSHPQAGSMNAHPQAASTNSNPQAASNFDMFSSLPSAQSTGGSRFTFQSQTNTGPNASGISAGQNNPAAMNAMAGTGTMPSGAMGAMNAAMPISSNMTPMQIETMFTAIGLIPDQIRDISGGQHGMASMLPEDIKVRAIQMRAMRMTPDQIADQLGDVMQARRAQMRRMSMMG